MSKVMATWYMNINPTVTKTPVGQGFLYESRKEADEAQTTIIPRIACVPVKVVVDSFDDSFIRFVED